MNADRTLEIQITDPDGKTRMMALRERITIGRQVGNDLRLDDQRISRQHAALAIEGETCQVIDLASSNGTFLDGEKLPPNVPIPFEPGGQLQIGPFTLTLLAQAAAAAPEIAAESAPAAEAQPAEKAPDADVAAPGAEAEAPGGAPGDIPDPVDADRPPVEAEGDAERGPTSARPPSKSASHRKPPPPSQPPTPPAPATPEGMIPPGLELESQRLITYLPGIYHTAFMRRFLGIFEAILTPIEWQIDNFDLFLDPGAAPADFLTWLAGWFDVAFDPSWDQVRRRQLLREAHQIYARRGTKWALRRALEIYTGESPKIIDVGEDLAPFTFKVVLPHAAARRERAMIERLIDAHKPAYTLYTVEFAP